MITQEGRVLFDGIYSEIRENKVSSLLFPFLLVMLYPCLLQSKTKSLLLLLKGTTVICRDLYAPIPIRRNMQGPEKIIKKVRQELIYLALMNPSTSIRAHTAHLDIFQCSKNTNILHDRLSQVSLSLSN